MDHLEIPPDAVVSNTKIPYLGSLYSGLPQYDYMGMDGFLERVGMSESSLRRGLAGLVARRRMSDPNEYAAECVRYLSLIQEWCWFGLMHEFALEFEEPIDRQYLIRLIDDGSYVLTTRFLKLYIERATQRKANQKGCSVVELASSCYWGDHDMSINPISVKAQNATTISQALQKARTIVTWLNGIAVEYHPRDLLFPELVPSINSLFEMVNMTMMVGLQYVPLKGSEISIFHADGMITRGWCQTRIVWDMGATVDHLMSMLPSHDERSHTACTRTNCVYSPKSPLDVRPRHVHRGCSCSLFEAPSDLLASMIDAGAMPGLELEGGLIQSYQSFKVVDIKDRPFVAISHVWAHGLGNPLSNELPVCQLQRLFRLIKEISEPETCLWIDTLFVPAHPEYKKRAIQGLRKVYGDAKKVLVLDRFLLQVGRDSRERLLQVLLSDWATRLWTLQEGLLAEQVYVQFKDEAVPILSLAPGQAKADFNSALSFLWKNPEFHLTALSWRIHSANTALRNLFEPLGRRRVTVAADEPVCLATLFGLELDDYPAGVGMVDVYRALQGAAVCAEIMFICGPRLAEPGLRWAPASLLSHGEIHNSIWLDGLITSAGLALHTDCIFIESLPLPRSARSPNGRIVIDVYHDLDDPESVHACIIVDEPDDFERALVGVGAAGTTGASRRAVILHCTTTAAAQTWRFGVLALVADDNNESHQKGTAAVKAAAAEAAAAAEREKEQEEGGDKDSSDDHDDGNFSFDTNNLVVCSYVCRVTSSQLDPLEGAVAPDSWRTASMTVEGCQDFGRVFCID